MSGNNCFSTRHKSYFIIFWSHFPWPFPDWKNEFFQVHSFSRDSGNLVKIGFAEDYNSTLSKRC